ncbi:MAG: UTP--glucose-1-phosphate uridylyltransferase GalU [Deltaproteobacteria bacterium]|nr:UTP--glucose-1-phosphate uridylyltransferase GalU [Deltaproteobacteria bacterium]
MKIRKAVFPVAGLGTRFLPATKAMPKEMLPIVDKPLIQYAVEEAFQSGIEQIIFVTGRNKEALEDHFDRHNGLESTLMEKGKTQLLDSINKMIPDTGTIIYTRQSKPLGLGHAIWCARDIVGDEPFAVLLADDLIKSETPVLAQMLKAYEKRQSSLVAVVEVPRNETNRYGILDAEETEDGLSKIRGLIEKPDPDKAPSNLAIIGRYILTPEIFKILGHREKGAGGEIQLTDAMARLLDKQSIFGFQFEGERFDCGDKAGFQMANISYALARPDISSKLKPFIKTLLK